MEHLLEQGHKVMVFTSGAGLDFFRDRFPSHKNLTVLTIAPIYYAGTEKGIDFKKTAYDKNNQQNSTRINALAMHKVHQEFGCPDLVISDYDPVAAQYAYVKRAPLITIDQQSKYLVGHFMESVEDTSIIDEIERLSVFFPRAEKRIAVSFFKVEKQKDEAYFDVEVFPPMLRRAVIDAKGAPLSREPSILMYISAQQLGEQPMEEWLNTLESALPEEFSAHIFLPLRLDLPQNTSNVFYYHHGDKRFDQILFASHGVISTAGHNLLSEAMHLEKPLYALPLPAYEQQINASIITNGSFGISSSTLTQVELHTFFANLDQYAENIRKDSKYLFKEPGNELVLQEVDHMLQLFGG